MKDFEYQKFYEAIGKVNGWNFSHLRVSADQADWDFNNEVINRCNKRDSLLDIGTGGGENLLEIAHSVERAIGIDLSGAMIESAKDNLKRSRQDNVRFIQMFSKDLRFPEDSFNIVTSRHAPFDSFEVAKVLKKGGVFLTQQVSEGDKQNIKNIFGRGQSFTETDGTLKEKYRTDLKDAGFSKVQSYDSNVLEYYERPEDLLFLLRHTPIIPNFGQDKKDLEFWDAVVENNQTARGICTNSKRFLIVAVK
ncbi:class I SAM-dependent methyltransferase [Planococcus soli]|uniref:class I SAM-dependent methyltransferase n=1 Tax=Planococcus soli TaxID=2666072 RepID=UPI00115C919C|nr:class I SAM-dependent methyltransferase [Planococcus soli]